MLAEIWVLSLLVFDGEEELDLKPDLDLELELQGS